MAYCNSMSFCFSVLKTQSIMYFLHSVSVSGFNSLARHGLSNKKCCNKAWKPMIYKVLHVSHCGGRSHLICWPWLSYVKFAQCAGVEKKVGPVHFASHFPTTMLCSFGYQLGGLVFFSPFHQTMCCLGYGSKIIISAAS